jgi:hypothetical protein
VKTFEIRDSALGKRRCGCIQLGFDESRRGGSWATSFIHVSANAPIIMRQTRIEIRLPVLVLKLRTPPLYDITHVVEYQGRECPHALPLFGTKRFVEWLPRLGEFIQIG